MKKIAVLLLPFLIFLLFSCQKEYSLENGGNNPNIIGTNCRIAKIVYRDSAGIVAKGSVADIINTIDQSTNITVFDSLTASIDYSSIPSYAGDTIHINADEYYLVNPSVKNIRQFHGLIDPTNPGSPQIDIIYSYDGSGYLVNKSYALTSAPGSPYQSVDYTYTGGNLTHMVSNDLTVGDKIADADITYYSFLAPQNFLYIFPDEASYAPFTQFLNFGKKPLNAVQNLIIKYYDPGNILRVTAVSSFTNYTQSVDGYILSVVMSGSDQPCLPAPAGKLLFSYMCK